MASVTQLRAGYVDVTPDPVLVRCTAPDALSNLVGVLGLAADAQLRCSAATRCPWVSTVKLVEDVLVAGDYYDVGQPIAAFAWPLLILTGGLAVLARGDDPPRPPREALARGDDEPHSLPRPRLEGATGVRLELTPRGRAVLAGPSYADLGALWDRWLRSVSTDELSRVEAIKGQRRPSTLTPAVRRRAAVAAALGMLEPGAWTDIDELFGLLRTQRPPLMAARSLLALWRLYIADSYYGSLGHAGPRVWDILEGRYALCVLFEYAATAGLIDVAYADPRGARDDYRALWGADQYAYLSRYDGLLAVRVNELGAAILHDPGALPGIGLPVPRGSRRSRPWPLSDPPALGHGEPAISGSSRMPGYSRCTWPSRHLSLNSASRAPSWRRASTSVPRCPASTRAPSASVRRASV
jgi:hypothetical protein